jgi:hypothetical protein
MAAASCAARPPETPVTSAFAALRYDARLVTAEPYVLAVDMEIVGGARMLEASAPRGLLSLSVEDARGSREVAVGESRLPVDCQGTCRVHYRYDLTLSAHASGDSLDVAVMRGGDVIAPASTWLLRPAPPAAHVPVDIAVHVPEDVEFATGLRHGEAPGHFDVRSEELPTLGYTAFGRFSRRKIAASGGDVEVVVLRGERAAEDEAIARWVSVTAGALDTIYGRFPVRRAALFVVPQPGGDRVAWGKTLPSGGASVAVTLGATADARALEEDWVLAHELFHLGVPSFWNEGRWLDEGLATYYEPVLRARARMLPPEAVWEQFVRQMPRGIREDAPLVKAADHDRIYWGGAVFALRADVEIRRRTGGSRSLDDGLRRALEMGADATHLWSLERYLRVIDDAAGVPVLQDLAAPGACAELDALQDLLRALGVRPTTAGVDLADDAPLAPLRRALLSPLAPAKRSAP